MVLKRALLKCDRIRLLGNRILMNHNNKFNLYNSPTVTYNDYAQHQSELIAEFKLEILELHKNINEDSSLEHYKITPF